MISLDKLGLILISLTLMNLNGILANPPQNQREKRLFSVFNVVRFQNEACQTLNNNQLGVCYIGEECLKRQGILSGHCASGFGVCCLFQVGCNAVARENCTYFSSSIGTIGSGFCNAKVCPCSSDICQIRLDFLDFSIAGPSVSAQVAGFSLNGNQIENTQGPAITTTSRCITDFFQITNPGGSNPPIICGQNSGEHVYVDSSSSCNDLSFFIQEFNPTPSSGQDSSWLIKITQFSCGFDNLAPSGCTQWLFGSNQGIVKTFNYDAGIHLANQDQSICIRREVNTCSICWTPQVPQDFQLSGVGNMGITDPDICCGYGLAGVDIRGYDCLLIPFARTVGKAPLKANRFCGASRGLAAIGSQTVNMVPPLKMGLSVAATICSNRVPFALRFISDNFEFAMEIRPQKGFRLLYQLSDCT